MSLPDIVLGNSSWEKAFSIQKKCVDEFGRLSSLILGDSLKSKEKEKGEIKFSENIFSTLFIAVSSTLALSDEKLEFYGVLNHCLRTLVTGCDNLFDNEYKEVLPLSLQGRGTLFKSVLHIIAAEKIIALHLSEHVARGSLGRQQAALISKAALEVLLPSGVEEHEEEKGAGWLDADPDYLINNILYRKTGVLFESPVKLIQKGENLPAGMTELPLKALSTFGIACQLLDDVMDTGEDLLNKKCNAVISLALKSAHEKKLIENLAHLDNITESDAEKTAKRLGKAKRECIRISFRYFSKAHKLFREIAPEFAGKELLSLAAAARRQIMTERNTSK